MERYKMWINGEWVPAVSGETYAVVNPATEEVIAQVPKGDQRDVDLAVEAARKAFPIWSKKSQAERTEIIVKMAAALKEHVEEFAKIDTLDHGTPITMARHMVFGAANNLEFNAQASRSLMGDVIPIRPDAFHYFKREPVGVAALIIPWNVPLVMVGSKLGAALSVGNTCIIKPPSIDSLAALKFGEILEKAGLPKGAVNIVTGPGHSVGETLATHPGIDLISFTGSSETGKAIMAAGSQTVKRMTLELGGKNPFIILDDADLEKTAQKAVMSSYANCGMVCASPGRYYIPENKYNQFVERFMAHAQQWIFGDPLDEKTMMGPVVSAEHRDVVEGYIKSGIEQGARLMLGGKRPTSAPLNKGYFIPPTVFTDVTQDMKIAREEIFGPVACMMKYSSEDEVLELANDNHFGLSASVWTQNINKAIHFANELQVGAVWINDHLTISPEMPWGGFKESGIGKENSMIGLEEYTQLKLVAINLA